MTISRFVPVMGILLATCLATPLLLSSPAFAGPKEDAAAFKSNADTAFDARRFAEALEGYEKALELHRDARLHYNIAQALAALERHPEALISYQAFIAEAPAGTLDEAQQATLFALLEELKGKIARIEVTCDVPGARILVRGDTVGTTPLSDLVVVNAGQAKIEAIAEGYKPFEATVPLTGGATKVVVVALERVDFRGMVAVASNVAGAEVYVDDERRGVTPLELRLNHGTHVVEARASDHIAQSAVATVEPGKRAELTLTLERAPDYSVAIVGFAIGGIGLAAGAVTGILAFVRFSKAEEQCDTAAMECGPAAQEDLLASTTWGTVSTVALGVGAAGIGLGIFGLLTASPSATEPAVDVAIVPGGFALHGSF